MAFQVTRDQFCSILPQLHVFPNLVTVYNSVKQYSSGQIDECSVELFGYPKLKPVLWLVFKLHKYSIPYVLIQATTEEPKVLKQGIHKVFDLISVQVEQLDALLIVASDGILAYVDLEMKALGTHPHITCNDPYTMFYMDKDQCDKLMKTDLKLPEGFTFVDLEADRDAEMTTAQMPYAGNGDLEQARSRMRTMPSVGIKHDLTNEIISFEYCSGFGHITHQYTFPEFRGLGLGRLVELRLCQKVIQELGIAPVKQVSRCRPRVIAMSKGSPFWTAYKNAQGSDILGYFRAYRKHPQEMFAMTEN